MGASTVSYVMFPNLQVGLLNLYQTDSLRLWQTVCSNKILAEVEFVLFLNKLDILTRKIKSGIQFSSFVSSYGDKPNDPKAVTRCMYLALVSSVYPLIFPLKISWMYLYLFIKNIPPDRDHYIGI